MIKKYDINLVNNIFSYLLIIFPLSLIFSIFVAEIICFVCTLYFLINLSKKNYKKYLCSDFAKFFFVFYLIILITSFLNFYNVRWFVPAFFYFRIFLFSLAIWYILDHSNAFTNRKKNIILITFFLLIADSLIQSILGKNILGYEIYKFSRISSFFKDELILGSYVIRFLPILLIFLFINEKENKLSLYLNAFILSLLIYVVILSGERVSFILTILYFSLIFLISSKLKKILVLVIVFLSFILILNSFFNLNKSKPKMRLIDKTINQFQGLDTNKRLIDEGVEKERKLKKIFNKFYIFSYDHHSHYLLASKMIAESPLIGKGVRGFRWLCFKTLDYKNFDGSGCSTHPHHTYIQILVSSGFFGFLMICYLFYITCKRFYLNLKDKNIKYKKNFFFQNILLAIMIANLFPLLPSGNFYNNFLSFMYFYPVGFYLYFKNQYLKNE